MQARPLPRAVCIFALAALATLLALWSRGIAPTPRLATARTVLANLAPAFEPLPGGRAFGARQGNLSLAVSPAEAVVRLRNNDQAAEVRFRLLGADPTARGEGAGLLPGRTHYLLGNRPEKWRRNVPRYEKARFSAVYPGIDAVFYGGKEGLEYDFVVQPGADPARIRIEAAGAARAELDGAGDLVLHTAAGELRQRRPVAYQEINGRRAPVPAAWLLEPGGNTLAFDLGAYDPAFPLVIDPVLVYSSYLGGSAADFAAGIAVDAQGLVYVALRTDSGDLPRSPTAFQPPQGQADLYIAKLDLTRPGPSALVFGTYLGGAAGELGAKIAVGADGSVYAAGTTQSSNFPTTLGAFRRSRQGPADGFLAQLAPSGSTLLYSTYFGGNNSDEITGLALDAAGRAYVCGETASTTLPVKTAFQSQLRGTADGFVAKLDPFQAGVNSLAYSTYLGGSGLDVLSGIAVDASGRGVVMGYTESNDYPLSAGALQRARAGDRDIVLSRVAATGAVLDYSTYFGGSNTDAGSAIALDRAGRAYLLGYTQSPGLPVVRGFQASYAGGLDAFLARIDMGAAGAASLLYSTYLGGSGFDVAIDLAVDAGGHAYLTGTTMSESFPVTLQRFRPGSGTASAFITRIDPARLGAASLRYSTAFGDPLHPAAGARIAVDAARTAYVAGVTDPGSDIPITPGAFQTSASGEGEVFLIKVRSATPAAPTNLDAIPLSATQVMLVFQDRGNNETGFEIQRRLGTGNFAPLGTIGADTTVVLDSPPPPAPAVYRVRAVNDEDESPFSNLAQFEPLPPTSLQDLRAFSGASTTVDLRWTDSRREARYRIERRTARGGSVVLADLPFNTTFFRDSTVGANIRYTYRVTPLNALGAAPAAETEATVLRAPVNLDARSVFTSSNQIHIVWQDQTTLETGFELQRVRKDTLSVVSIPLGPNVTSYTDTGLARTTTYLYRVRAVAPTSVSNFSNVDEASTGRIPAAPSLVQAAAAGPDRVTVSWQDNSRFEAGFRVERRPLDGPFQAVGTVPPDTTTFTDEGLTPRTTYRYRVFGFNDGGDSPSSNVAEVDTPGPLGGRLRLAPERLTFGVVLAGQSRARQLTLRNAGSTEDLRVTLRVGEGPFRLVGPAELVLPPGGRRTVKVRFRPTGGGRAQGRLVLESTDPRRPQVRVPLTGWSYGLR